MNKWHNDARCACMHTVRVCVVQMGGRMRDHGCLALCRGGVRCGVLWCDVVLCDCVVLCVFVVCGVVLWCGVVWWWCGVVWCGVCVWRGV